MQILTQHKDIALRPVRIASSRPALKAYLNTALFVATTAILFGLASTAYILFYMTYIPQVGIQRVVHLQYGYVHPRSALQLRMQANHDEQRWPQPIRSHTN